MNKKQITKAKRARTQIAKTFDALDNGQISPESVLNDVPPCLYRIRVYDVIRRFPRMGREGAEKLLRHSKVWPLTPMSKLTVEERHALLTNLPPRVRKAA